MTSRDRIEELESRVAELTAHVESLTRVHEHVAPSVGERSPSRRGLLRLAGAAAVGAVAAVGSKGTPAAALDPNDLQLGTVNQTAGLTELRQRTNPGGGLYTAVFVQTGPAAGEINSDALAFPSAFAARSGIATSPNGVFGTTNQATGHGVVGETTAAGGTAVRGKGVLVGVAGDASDPLGIGVTGTGGTGVKGTGTAIGVEGTSTAGFGVRGAGTTGVLAVGTATGVNGTVTTADGVGVSGSGGDTGIGVRGIGGFYAISAMKSSKANLFLQPNNDASGVPSVKTVPTTRTDAHLAGELECVNGDLYLCVVSGTPGTWRKLSGPNAAGSFHALAPGRVYDSRVTQPSPGAINVPGTRLLNVSDRRDLVTGASNQANFVPSGATAISCNVTVVDTVQSGFLAINPGGIAVVNAATVNWSESGQILNNGVMLTLNANREVTVIAGGVAGASTHFVIDVNGYFL